MEICCPLESVKYLFKYIDKGHDRQMVQTDQQQAAAAERDETGEFHDLRSIGASEAWRRLFHFDMSSRSPAVEPLQVHLENLQKMVLFEDGQEQRASAAEPRDTPLTAWMRYNRENAAVDPDCLALLYADFPRHCRWDKDRRRWIRRQNHQAVPAIGRVVTSLLGRVTSSTCACSFTTCREPPALPSCARWRASSASLTRRPAVSVGCCRRTTSGTAPCRRQRWSRCRPSSANCW